MNKFESKFFEKYIPEGHVIEGIIHVHFIEIWSKLFLWLSMGAFFPTFIYIISGTFQEVVPFYYLEGLLIFTFIKVVYDIFDWYNDVIIVTDFGIISLDWTLFKTNSVSVDYEKIEGLEVDQAGINNKLLKRGNIIIHKFGNDTITLKNAQNPYKAINFIERISQEASERNTLEQDKFDIIMDALGGVVENYMGKKMSRDEKEEELHKAIEKIEKNDGTIDLR